MLSLSSSSMSVVEDEKPLPRKIFSALLPPFATKRASASGTNSKPCGSCRPPMLCTIRPESTSITSAVLLPSAATKSRLPARSTAIWSIRPRTPGSTIRFISLSGASAAATAEEDCTQAQAQSASSTAIRIEISLPEMQLQAEVGDQHGAVLRIPHSRARRGEQRIAFAQLLAQAEVEHRPVLRKSGIHDRMQLGDQFQRFGLRIVDRDPAGPAVGILAHES